MLAGYLVFPSIWTIMVIVIFSTLLCFFKKNFSCSFFRITLNNFLRNLHFLYLIRILCSLISKSLYCGRVNFIYLFFQFLFQSFSTCSMLVSMEFLLLVWGRMFPIPSCSMEIKQEFGRYNDMNLEWKFWDHWTFSCSTA